MSEQPTAGTFRLDGMIQGPTPDSAALGDVEAWIAKAKESGFIFHLRVDGPNFSIVPDSSAQRTSRLPSPNLEAILSQGVETLLRLLPGQSLTSVFSTLRSEEFHAGEVIQTVYAVAPDGSVSTEQRTVEVETQDPLPELNAASIKRAIIPALVVFVLALLVSSIFVDYRKLWGEARDKFVDLKKEEVTIESGAVSEYIKIELEEIVDKGRVLKLNLSRGAKWDSAFDSTPSSTETWSDFVNRLAIHQGRLRIEFLNKEGKILGKGEMKIAPLKKKKSAELLVPARFEDRLARVVIRP